MDAAFHDPPASHHHLLRQQVVTGEHQPRDEVRVTDASKSWVSEIEAYEIGPATRRDAAGVQMQSPSAVLGRHDAVCVKR